MAKSKKQKRNSEKPFNFYGIRKTRNPKYMSVSLVREDEDGERQWINVPVNVKYIKAKGNDIYLKLKFLSDEDEDKDEDEDGVDYNEVARLKNSTKPTTKASRVKAMDIDEDSPF